jgi:hypothetical protein
MIKTKSYFFSNPEVNRKQGVVVIELECGHTVERDYANEPQYYCFCTECDIEEFLTQDRLPTPTLKRSDKCDHDWETLTGYDRCKLCGYGKGWREL